MLPLLAAGFMFVSTLGHAGEIAGDPALLIRSGEQDVSLKRSELLKRPDVTALHVEHDPAYKGEARDYPHAVPLRALLGAISIPEGKRLQFECTDGFSAPLAKDRILGDGGKAEGAVPYLAIQAPGENWPTVTAVGGAKSAGPYYLVWKDPEKSKIGTEEWPFALAGFTVKDSIETTFPQILPEASVAKNSPIRRGYAVFAKNCFACHTLNLAGQSKLGPDLNVPLSPTEYFSESNLKKLIRNPQDLRTWPESKMKGFAASEVSDAEITDLIAYFKQMARQRAK